MPLVAVDESDVSVPQVEKVGRGLLDRAEIVDIDIGIALRSFGPAMQNEWDVQFLEQRDALIVQTDGPRSTIASTFLLATSLR